MIALSDMSIEALRRELRLAHNGGRHARAKQIKYHLAKKNKARDAAPLQEAAPIRAYIDD